MEIRTSPTKVYAADTHDAIYFQIGVLGPVGSRRDAHGRPVQPAAARPGQAAPAARPPRGHEGRAIAKPPPAHLEASAITPATLVTSL